MIDVSGIDMLIKLIFAFVLSDFAISSILRPLNNVKLEWLFKSRSLEAATLLAVSYLLTGSVYCIILAPGYLLVNIIYVMFRDVDGKNVYFYYIVCSILLLSTWTLIVGVSNIMLFMRSLAGNPDILIILSAYMIVIWPCGVLIGKITEKWRMQIHDDPDEKGPVGLDSAGRWIGWTERVMILTFIFLGQYMAVGFLVAAKSIFRFDKIRKSGEYYLIGTLISFTLAILIGVFVVIMMKELNV